MINRKSILFLFALIIASLWNISFSQLVVTARTFTYGGEYAPQCPAVMWIQKPDSTFVKTFGWWAGSWWKPRLIAWSKVSFGDVDGLSSATRSSHTAPLSATWDMTGQDNKPVTAGTYEFWVEFTEGWSDAKSAKGTIVIDETAKIIEGDTSSAYIKDFSATYSPVPLSVRSNQGKSTEDKNVFVSYNRHSAQLIIESNGLHEVQISNIKGEVIKSFTGELSRNPAICSLRGLARGVCFVKVTSLDGKKAGAKRIIIQ